MTDATTIDTPDCSAAMLLPQASKHSQFEKLTLDEIKKSVQ